MSENSFNHSILACDCGTAIEYRIRHMSGGAGASIYPLVCPKCKKENSVLLPSVPEIIAAR
jgi:hypothetical protein